MKTDDKLRYTTYLERAFADFSLELPKGQDGDDTINSCNNRGEVELPSREVSRVHLTNHAANSESLQVLVLKFNEGAAVANDSKEVDVVVLLADFFALAEAEELHHLRHAVDVGKRETLEYICVLIEDLKDALGLVRIDVCSQSHLAWVPLS